MSSSPDLSPQEMQGHTRDSSFRACTIKFTKECQKYQQQPIQVKAIGKKLGFKKRRFYDLINILDAVGCCPRMDVDSFIWLGFDNIVKKLTEIATTLGVFDPTKTLSDIIINTGCLSISKVAIDFIMCFISMEKETLNIIEVATFMSRKNGREQTTRCKLYQAAAILDNIGILSKTNETSGFKINEKFFIRCSMHGVEPDDTFNILNLLRNYDPTKYCPYIQSRRTEFRRAIHHRI